MGLSVNDVTGIGAVANLATDLVDRLFPDPIAQATQRAAYLQKAQELDNQIAQGQMAINQVEAGSTNAFASNWRPFIGWVCGAAFAYHFILQPFMAFCLTEVGHPVDLPSFDMDTLTTVLYGMLGLGSLRTLEKVTGTASKFPWQK